MDSVVENSVKSQCSAIETSNTGVYRRVNLSSRYNDNIKTIYSALDIMFCSDDNVFII